MTFIIAWSNMNQSLEMTSLWLLPGCKFCLFYNYFRFFSKFAYTKEMEYALKSFQVTLNDKMTTTVMSEEQLKCKLIHF